jgi:hypothetical protein
MANLTDWEQFCTLVSAHRAQLRFCLRVTVAGLLAFSVAQVLPIPLHGLRVVLTAVVVTEMIAGRSLRAIYDRDVRWGRLCRYHRSAHSPHHSDCAGRRSCTHDRAVSACGSAQSELSRRPFSAVLMLLISS